MDLKNYLVELYEYNYWANKRYLAVAETLSEEQLFRKQGHSWDSVHAIFVHVMSSERMWQQRWHGKSGTFLDPKDFLPLRPFANTGSMSRITCAASSPSKQCGFTYPINFSCLQTYVVL